jgi:uncharacterized membrane protein
MFDPFRMNDCRWGRYIIVATVLQISVLTLITLDLIGFSIPVIREFVVFVYLMFMPGVVILRILGIHKLTSLETLLLTIGVSVAFLMITGLAMNIFYPMFGLANPISTIPLIVTISIILSLLYIVAFARDRNFSDSNTIFVNRSILSRGFILLTLPIVAIFGTYFMNLWSNNSLLLLLIASIALIAAAIALNKFVPRKLYPLTLFAFAISLLYHRSLISNYLTGFDVWEEYYFCKLVLTNSYWDFTIPARFNSMVSVTILPAILSCLLNLDPIQIFKVVYPFIFSLMPLGLYFVYETQTTSRIAFFSTFFFISISSFYTELPQLAKQEIAELFFALMLLLMVSKKASGHQRAFLCLLFSVSIIISLYLLSYFFIVIGLIAFSLTAVRKRLKWPIFKNKLSGSENITSRITGKTFIMFFLITLIFWYTYVGSSEILRISTSIVSDAWNNLSSQFLNPLSREAFQILAKQSVSPAHDITRVLYLILELFIGVGMIRYIINRRDFHFSVEYTYLSIASLLTLITVVFISGLSQIGVTRTYHILLFLLAPFCFIGCTVLIKLIPNIRHTRERSLKIFSIIVIVSFLFNTEFVHATIGFPLQTSISLGHLDNFPIYSEPEMKGVTWLLKNMNTSFETYSDFYAQPVFIGYLGSESAIAFYKNGGYILRPPKEAYVYFNHQNLESGKITLWFARYQAQSIDLRNLTFMEYRSVIYSNGYCEIHN